MNINIYSLVFTYRFYKYLTTDSIILVIDLQKVILPDTKTNKNNNNNNNNNNKVDSYDDGSSSILNLNIQSPDDNLKSIAKVEQDGNLILFKSFNSYKICNLMVIVKSDKTSFYIKFFKKHLITTEIIKISAEYNNNTTKKIIIIITIIIIILYCLQEYIIKNNF